MSEEIPRKLIIETYREITYKVITQSLKTENEIQIFIEEKAKQHKIDPIKLAEKVLAFSKQTYHTANQNT
jgi:hypothetical protein